MKKNSGYGSTYPALGYQNDNPTNCFFINFICSLEALIGVLYSGFCGAILFGKVLRIQSHAQVTFSDPIVVRYGPGLKESNDRTGSDDEDDHEHHHDAEAVDKMPCPVLEFRIVNRLYGEPGGEIMDGARIISPRALLTATHVCRLYNCMPGTLDSHFFVLPCYFLCIV